MNQQDFQNLARSAAKSHSLDESLVCAVCEQESGWNPWAIRYEAAFFAKYIAGLYTANKISVGEAQARAFSWGLMQIMGQVARELGFANTYLASLLDPATNLDWGCKHLAKKVAIAKGDTRHALLLWNGGGNSSYPDDVFAKMPNYPAAQTNAHADDL